MLGAYIVAAILVSVVLVASGRGKLVKDEQVVTGLTKARVPLSWYPALALTEFAGALGLLIGIAWRPLGIAAATGVVLYFTGAALAHLTAKDVGGALVPAVILAVAAATCWFAIASA
jgi:DoxX-like protein